MSRADRKQHTSTTRSTSPERVWVGGTATLPCRVGDVKRGSFVPAIALWVELPAGIVVGCELTPPESTGGALGRALRGAMESPMLGPPRRPDRVRVSEIALAQEVRSVLPDVVVEIAPTPELEEPMAGLTDAAARDEDEPSYLDGDVGAESMMDLFRGAELLWRVIRWESVDEEAVLRVDIPALGVEGACLSIIGALGESRGFLLFPSLRHFFRFCEAAERNAAAPDRIDMGSEWLALAFDRGADLPDSMRREVAKHEWSVAAPEAYPVVHAHRRDGLPEVPTDEDVRIVAACATSLTAFTIRNGLPSTENDAEPVCQSFADEDDLVVRFTFPYEAFPLFEIEDPPMPPASRRASSSDPEPPLVTRIARFAGRRFGESWRAQARFFAERDGIMQLLGPWTLFHAEIDGRPVYELFLEAHERDLSPEDRSWLHAQRDGWLSLWEVLDVDPERGLTLRDPLSREVREVRERTASRSLRRRDVILGRVVRHGDEYVLDGIHPRPLPPWEAFAVEERMRRKLRRRRAVPVDRLRDAKITRYLIERWEEAVDSFDERRSIPPVLRNTDGDDLVFTTDRFALEPGSRDEIARRIAKMKYVTEEADSGERVYVFSRPDRKSELEGSTIIGQVSLTEEELCAETNSVERADRLRARLVRRCGNLIAHGSRERLDLPHPGSSPGEEWDGVEAPRAAPSAENLATLLEFKSVHYSGWPDESLPALGGSSPREAARTAAGRRAVDVLLKEMEHAEQGAPEGGRFDFGAIRREIGIEPA